MTRRHFEIEAHQAISKRLGRRGLCRYTLFETWSEGVKYAQSLSPDPSLPRALCGSLDRVQDSERLLAKFESQGVFSLKQQWLNSVSGFVPNVPAFLAGHPTSMRRRVKAPAESAPLMITVDLTGSIGIGSYGFSVRAAAILALVRILSASRAVELWLGAHYGTDERPSQHAGCFIRMPTQPLDLSIVSNAIMDHDLVDTLFARINRHDNRAIGSWSFGHSPIERDMQHELLSVAFPSAYECLAIPAAYVGELIDTQPEEWLKQQIKRFSPQIGDFAA